MTLTEPDATEVDADVVIVGAGPVGLYLAIRLADAGHTVVVVEKQSAAYARPRAVTFDDEIARLLSELGIDPDDDAEIERTDDWVVLRNGAREPIARLDWKGVTASGWHRLYWFHQPDLEARFADMVNSRMSVSLLHSWRAVDLFQDEEGATIVGEVTAADGSVSTRRLRSRYLVGADGANSMVRELAGLEVTDLGFHFDWLICDVVPVKPECFDPLVFDPPMSQICDPARPTTMVPGGPGRRRWEFMALPDEEVLTLNTPAKAWELLEPWGVNPETARLDRHVVWRFQAKYASEWRNRRILIAGDAAHLMPPFAGQGMCAGLRDGAGLAWRLDLVLRGLADDRLLDSYGSERRAHVAHFMHVSMELGKVVCITDPGVAAARDQALSATLDGSPLPPPPPLALGSGAWRAGDPQAGRLSNQGTVAHKGLTGRFDEVAARGWLLVGRGHDPVTSLSEPVAHAFAAVGGKSFAIGTAPSSITDIDGSYSTWFADLGVDTIMVRPDFYVAAATSRDATDTAVREVFDLAGIRLRPFAPTGVAEPLR
ncbi:bifunctional 3-(3-hydroxy-phenyl)propionate/3-hydroxycinnamic acid hydroxylase MhpA [Streptomyces umbrinus]